jgi:hypothetical protein
MAERVAAYRTLRTGSVTDVSRRGFWADLGSPEGLEHGMEANVIRAVDGEEVHVASAEVVQVDADSSFLRRTDRTRRRSVKAGDIVRVRGRANCVMVGPVGGEAPEAILDAFRSELLRSLKLKGGVSALDGPRSAAPAEWPWRPEPELCESALARGCSHALAGWGVVRGDSFHIVLGLVDASEAETVELFSGSAEMGTALAAAATTRPPGTRGSSPGAQAPGAGAPYAKLRRAFEITVPETIVAVSVLGDRREVFAAGGRSITIYRIGSGPQPLKEASRLPIESPPERIRCRDPVGTASVLDADSDGIDEIVLWSSVLSGPAGFEIPVDGDGGPVAVERSETFWLPWADPLGASSFIRGENDMAAPGPLGGTRFYSWRTADLNSDGVPEVVMTGVDGALTVRDSSLAILGERAGLGSALSVCDMDLDGVPEILVASSSPPAAEDEIAFYNWSGANLEEVWKLGGVGAGVVSLCAGRLDGDDLPDLVAATRAGPRARHGSLVVFLTSSP